MKQLKLFIIEDEDAHVELIRRALEQKPDTFDICVVSTIRQAQDNLSNFAPDIVLTDWRLPDGDGFELLKRPEIAGFPVIVMTSFGDETRAVEAI